jgi:hypothetical protein
MTVYTGRQGFMYGPRGNATVQYGKVTNWSLQGDLETLETTSLGDTVRSYTPGVQSFSGSATLLYYDDPANNNDASALLQKVITTGAVTSPVTLTLRLSANLQNQNANRDVTLNAYITSATIGASVGEVCSAQISFQATGALTAASI